MLTRTEIQTLVTVLVLKSELPIYEEGTPSNLLYQKLRIMQEAFLHYENLSAVKNIQFANQTREPEVPVVCIGSVRAHREDLTKSGAARMGTALHAGIKRCLFSPSKNSQVSPYIEAIKWARNFCECGLKEAKAIVDLTRERIK